MHFWAPLLPATVFLTLVIGPLPLDAKKRTSKAQEELSRFGDENTGKFHSTKCAFFCFFVPPKPKNGKDALIDVSFYRELSCSDLVYGFAEVHDHSLQLPTSNDLIPYASHGNFRLITSLQQLRNGPRVLLGIKQAHNVRFLDMAELARNVSRRLVFYARSYGFGGIFLKFDSDLLLTVGFDRFAAALSAEVKQDSELSKRPRLALVLSISSGWARYVWRRVATLDKYFNTFYLWADEIDSAEQQQPGEAVPVDPLYPSAGKVRNGQAFAQSAERLAATGVAPQKIVIGLSAWTRSYELATTVRMSSSSSLEDEEEARWSPQDEPTEPSPLPRVAGPGKTMPLQEFCAIRPNIGQSNYDNTSETVSYTNGHMWYSLNDPENVAAFSNKLDWVREQQFGGVGLFSIQADDPKGNCSHGNYPLHRHLGRQFKCRRRRRHQQANKNPSAEEQSPCTRLCIVDLGREVEAGGPLKIAQLNADWCSHLVLSSVTINPFLNAVPSHGLEKAMKQYNDWEQEPRPDLVISFTGSAEQWRLATLGASRSMLVESIKRVVDQYNADGVDINCANGGPDGQRHVLNFGKFLYDLRLQMPRKKIFLTLAPASFIDDPHYDFTAFDKSVDYFIAVGYRFHRYNNPHTGHHSPLFGAHDLLTQPRMTIQGMTNDMLHGQVPAEKIVVALSVEAMAMHFAENLSPDEGEQSASRSWDSHRIGEPASLAAFARPHAKLPNGALSHSEVCEILKEDRVHSRFLSDLAAPYLVNKDNEFIAFDNQRSIQIKSVWISLQGFAGIALHGVELDNVGGTCPQGQAFPILRTIVATQLCPGTCAAGPNRVDEEVMTTMNTTTASPLPTPSPKEQFIVHAVNAYHAKRPNSGDESGVQITTEPSPTTTPSLLEAETTDRTAPMVRRCQHPAPSQKHPFTLFCAFNLSTKMETVVNEYPDGHCDSLVLFGGIQLNATGSVNVNGQQQQMAELVEWASANGTMAVWAEVECTMDAKEWEHLLKDGNRPKLVSSVTEFIVDHNLTGVIMNCDRQHSANVRNEFAKFLVEIGTEFGMMQGRKQRESDKRVNKGTENSERYTECGMMALKIPLDRTNLSEAYDVDVLNRAPVLHAILLDAGIAFSKQKARLLNPLFSVGIAQPADTPTQNTTLSVWLSDGLRPQLLVLELPAYALLQKRESDAGAEPIRVSQAEVCKFRQKAGSYAHTIYDAVAAYWNTREEWLSAENEETCRYKLHFAMHRQLGGVLLRSLGDDDPGDECKSSGPFPLLHALHNARCSSPSRKPFGYAQHRLVERDSFGMSMSRG